ncbi:GGDEF domain-containing protein [Candidatus Poriferisodalis sp.]|uniref:GGDEF domain-containing protein n=1 Tax=Candidatus Poriferisodalis sp. TaxID=3101277 RepID=UPI003B023BD6
MTVIVVAIAVAGIVCFALGAGWGAKSGRTGKIDSLTGATGRKDALRHLDALLRRPRQGDYVVGVAFCDVDGLKDVNDTHGHAVGDDVLKHVAERLRHALRPSDVVARLGGDEFLVICDGVRARSDMDRIALRLREAMSPAILIDNALVGADQHGLVAVYASISIGTAASDGATTGSAELIERADRAMYYGKRIRQEMPTDHGPPSPLRLKNRRFLEDEPVGEIVA